MNIKSESKPKPTEQGQGQGTEEPVKWGKITQEIATWIGELIDIRWDKGTGKAKLEDAKDDKGKPVEKEVPCTFCFCGQHWPFNSQAYQAEDPRSHSAFAFFIHDRALLVQRKPHAGEADEDGDGWIYEAVAVITEKKDENGEPVTDPVTGAVLTEVVRRWCWPLYRLEEHRSFLVNAWYNYDPESGQFAGEPFENINTRIWYGYPFINIDTREFIAPFVDQQGNERPLGSSSAEGALFGRNMRLVVTKEQQMEILQDGTQEPKVDDEGNPVWCYVPHGEYEFCDSNGFIGFVPDVTKFEPNWKGRTVGLSNVNYLLIDNIPVARLVFDDLEIQASWRATVRWVFHINEETDVLTLLRVTVDGHWAARYYSGDDDDSPIPQPPRYAFAVQTAIIHLDEYNIYDDKIISASFNEFDEIILALDEDLSWRHMEMYNGIASERIVLDWCLLDNITRPYHTAKAGSSDGLVPALDVELAFYMGTAQNTTSNLYRRKVAILIGTDPAGICTVTKISGPESETPLSDMTAADFQTEWRDTEAKVSIRDSVSQVIAKAEKQKLETILVQLPSGEEEEQTVVVTETQEFLAKASGHEFDEQDKEVDADLTIVYLHRDATGAEFEISRDRQAWQNDNVTLVLTVFTMIDVEFGTYAFWEWTVLDEVDREKLGGSYVAVGNGGDTELDYPSLPQKVTWRHYVVDRNGRNMTHEFEYSIPHGRENTMSQEDFQSRRALSWLFLTRYIETERADGTLLRTYRRGGRFFVLPFFISGSQNDVAAYTSGVWDSGYGWDQIHPPSNFIVKLGGTKWLYNTTDEGGEQGLYPTYGYIFDTTNKSLYHKFNLHPFPNKSPSVWPYYKNEGSSLTTRDELLSGSWEAAPYLANILFSDSMEIHGAALEPGLWLYSFKIKGSEENPVVVKSAEMDKMLKCTGRDDTFFTLD